MILSRTCGKVVVSLLKGVLKIPSIENILAWRSRKRCPRTTLVQALDPKYVVVGIDFSNAFNTVECSAISVQVKRFFPHIESWFKG